MISSHDDNSIYAQRVNGFHAALSQAKLEHNLQNVPEAHYESRIAYAQLMDHLKEHPEITAVCSTADIMVPGILRAIYDSGKKPGVDIEVISFDGLEELEFSIPSVTTFAQPVEEMVNYVDLLLFQLIGKTGKHQNITFSPQFRKGETC